ncbi:hypothetical protein VCHENC01_4322 [Vibrio harveyi]|nr:hypothetical protein VCHENC01_4322 [Vibrio harveyi]
MIGDLNEKQNRVSRKRKASRSIRHPLPFFGAVLAHIVTSCGDK